MATALAAPRGVVALPSPLATVEKLEPMLSAAADSVTVVRFPPLAEIEQARVELVRSIEARPSPAQARQNIARLVLAYPQLKPETSEVYIAALESEASGYPLDVLVTACRAVLRSCKFVPTVAELVEQCEAGMEKRRRLLRGAETLARTAQAHERDRIERGRFEAEREAGRERALAGIRNHFGEAVPAWLTVARAHRGSVECSARGRILAEQGAAEGDGGAFVYVRRAALFGFALELQHATLPGYRRLVPADLLALAGHLCRDEDKAAAELIESTAPPSPCEGAGPPTRPVIHVLMKRALSVSATNTAARAEGFRVVEFDPWEGMPAGPAAPGLMADMAERRRPI